MSPASYHGVDHHVGHTPLIRLRRLSEMTGCEILGKAEFMNPGGSVKDRAALGIITTAEGEGQLKPGGTIVEARRIHEAVARFGRREVTVRRARRACSADMKAAKSVVVFWRGLR